MDLSKEWIYHTNIYEVNVRQYTAEGTFAAFGRHLPRLKKMGVHTLWFMPVTPISQKEKKGSMGSYYACSDYISINPEFGTMDDFREIIRRAHELEMKVIIDWVANHTGWDHVWTQQHPEWYEKDDTGNFKKASGTDDIIELDFKNASMRKAMTDAMKFWVKECDIDGFRCDLAFWVELDYWLEAIPEVNRLKPLFWLAESDPMEHPDYMKVFDSAYTWTWMHQTRVFAERKMSLPDLRKIAVKYESVPGIKAWFTTNHDENTWNGTEYEKYGGAALPLAVFSCTWPGIPLVYSGQELPNKKRLKFFDKDVIEWNDHPELEKFYADLLALHSTHPALSARSEVFTLHTSAEANVIAFLRKSDQANVIVLLNLSDHMVRFDMRTEWVTGNFSELFTGVKRNFGKEKTFEMNAWAYLVFRNDG